MFKSIARFFSWLRRTIDMLCERPDHLQRLAVIGAGVALYPLLLAFIYIMWKGFGANPELLTKQIDWLGWMAVGVLTLFGLVIVTLLGTIKGVRISGPGGSGVEFETSAGDGKGLSRDDDDDDDNHRRRGRRGRDEPEDDVDEGATKRPDGEVT